MTWRFAFLFLLILFIITNCSKKTSMTSVEKVRTWKPEEVSSFHPTIDVQLGWVPYEDHKIVQTGDFEWKIVKEKNESDEEKKIPILFVKSANEAEPIMLEMNIDNELLGKLVKHSAITQQPIRRPFIEFFEEAKCQGCHPEDVEVDFD